jgi:hypothetical protein
MYSMGSERYAVLLYLVMNDSRSRQRIGDRRKLRVMLDAVRKSGGGDGDGRESHL